MFAYLHHIGDFNKATRHLSRTERSVYRDLIELYYETEKPLSKEISKLCRLVLASTKEERLAVESMLSEYFHLTDLGYSHIRCELEIEKFKTAINKKSLAGKASAELRAMKRAEILGRTSTDVEHVLNFSSTDEQAVIERVGNTEPTNQLSLNPKPVIPIIIAQQADQTKKNPKGSRLTKDWIPTQEYWDEARSIKPFLTDMQLQSIASSFRDYWIAKSGADATKLDWLATWRNWVRRDNTFANNKQPAKPAAGALNFTSTDYNNGINPDGSF